jgi:hypothetical protein
VSADGRRLAFEVEDSTTRTTAIMTMTTVGTDLRAIGPRVSGLTGDVNILGVTPTGDAILFSTPNAANGTAKRQYWRIGVEGGELKEVQLVNGVVGEVSFNPGGRQMVFTMESAQTAVMAMENFLPPARGAR